MNKEAQDLILQNTPADEPKCKVCDFNRETIKQIDINGKVEKDINKFPVALQVRETI